MPTKDVTMATGPPHCGVDLNDLAESSPPFELRSSARVALAVQRLLHPLLLFSLESNLRIRPIRLVHLLHASPCPTRTCAADVHIRLIIAFH